MNTQWVPLSFQRFHRSGKPKFPTSLHWVAVNIPYKVFCLTRSIYQVVVYPIIVLIAVRMVTFFQLGAPSAKQMGNSTVRLMQPTSFDWTYVLTWAPQCSLMPTSLILLFFAPLHIVKSLSSFPSS